MINFYAKQLWKSPFGPAIFYLVLGVGSLFLTWQGWQYLFVDAGRDYFLAWRVLEGEALEKALKGKEVLPKEIRTIRELQDRIPPHNPVAQIYIYLTKKAHPQSVESLSPRVLGIVNFFQCACHLKFQGSLSEEGLEAVAANLVNEYVFTRLELARSLSDLWKREVISKDFLEQTMKSLKESNLLPEDLQIEGQRFTLFSKGIPLQDFVVKGA